MTEDRKKELIEEVMRLEQQMRPEMGHHAPAPWLGLDLTIGQLKSLFFLNYRGSANLSGLAAALGVSSPNATGIVDRLVEQGLVTRQEDPANRRMVQLRTTEKAQAMLARLRETGMGKMTGLLSRLTEDELAGLAKGLAGLARVAGELHGRGGDEAERT